MLEYNVLWFDTLALAQGAGDGFTGRHRPVSRSNNEINPGMTNTSASSDWANEKGGSHPNRYFATPNFSLTIKATLIHTLLGSGFASKSACS
jgi:hypothetical protein